MKKESDKILRLFIVAIIAFLLFMLITVFCAVKYGLEVKNLQHENRALVEQTLQNLVVQGGKNNDFKVVIKSEDLEKLNLVEDAAYRDFLVKYNENQADWLNAWLTILAIALAFIGLIAPLCFMKLYDDKKEEMDEIIKEGQRQKAKTKVNVTKMETQLKEVDAKAAKMEEELASVKKYVSTAQAYAKYTDGMQKYHVGKISEACKALEEAYAFNPDASEIVDALASFYFETGEYNRAIELINKALETNDTFSNYYDDLACAYSGLKEYEKVIKYEDLAIKYAQNEEDKAFFYSIKATAYANLNNATKALEFVEKARQISSASSVLSNCSIALLNVQNYKLAIELLEPLAASVDNAAYDYNLVEGYIFDKQYAKALKIIKKYVLIQNNKTCYGIYEDDYEKWMKELEAQEASEDIKELKVQINNLEKRKRL